MDHSTHCHPIHNLFTCRITTEWTLPCLALFKVRLAVLYRVVLRFLARLLSGKLNSVSPMCSLVLWPIWSSWGKGGRA